MAPAWDKMCEEAWLQDFNKALQDIKKGLQDIKKALQDIKKALQDTANIWDVRAEQVEWPHARLKDAQYEKHCPNNAPDMSIFKR